MSYSTLLVGLRPTFFLIFYDQFVGRTTAAFVRLYLPQQAYGVSHKCLKDTMNLYYNQPAVFCFKSDGVQLGK